MPKYVTRAVRPGLFSGTVYDVCVAEPWHTLHKKMMMFSSHLSAAESKCEMTPFMLSGDASVYTPLICANGRQ